MSSPEYHRPNVLFIMADQLGRHMLGCYGNLAIRTPNIDRLARSGVICDSNYIQNPVCGPSRCSIFTGRYPSVCGARMNGTPLPASEITLPQAMAAAGYSTFAAGKLHFRPQCNTANPRDGSHSEHEGTQPYYGFQEYAISGDEQLGAFERWVKKNHPNHVQEVMMEPNGARERGRLLGHLWDGWIPQHPPECQQSFWVADTTADFIRRQNGAQPWFAFCSFSDPHHPFNPPEPYASMYNGVALPPLVQGEGEPDNFPRMWRAFRERPNFIKDYTSEDWDLVRRLAYGLTTLVDDAIGRVLTALRDSGQDENTLVVFTSDHGEMLGDHHLLYKGTFVFDQLIRTPLLWRWPAENARGNGRRIESLTQSLDLMPTMLESCGVPIPRPVQGRTMQPLLRGDTVTGRDWVLNEMHVLQRFATDWEREDVNTLVTPEWKFSLRADGDTGMLYDRRSDPQELRNLWHDPTRRELRLTLAEQLARCLSEIKEHDWRRETLW